MWQWFKEKDIWEQLTYIVFIFGIVYCLYVALIIPVRWNFAETKTDCGVFVNYYDQVQSGKGSTWTNRWLVIQGQTGKTYQFMYDKEYHKPFSFIRNDLQQGQKLCFEYFDPWLKHMLGKTFLKSIKLTGEN